MHCEDSCCPEVADQIHIFVLWVFASFTTLNNFHTPTSRCIIGSETNSFASLTFIRCLILVITLQAIHTFYRIFVIRTIIPIYPPIVRRVNAYSRGYTQVSSWSHGSAHDLPLFLIEHCPLKFTSGGRISRLEPLFIPAVGTGLTCVILRLRTIWRNHMQL